MNSPLETRPTALPSCGLPAFDADRNEPESGAYGAVMEKTLRIVRSEEEIRNRILTLGNEIRAKATTGDLTIVGILDDTFVFLADLIRTLDTPLSCCFMK